MASATPTAPKRGKVTDCLPTTVMVLVQTHFFQPSILEDDMEFYQITSI
jgi:hypothetical protein